MGKNTKNIIKKAYKRIWIIKRLQLLGSTRNQVLEVCTQQVRSVLEVAVPVWHPALTISDKLNTERVQKSVCHIIFGRKYSGYKKLLAALGLTVPYHEDNLTSAVIF